MDETFTLDTVERPTVLFFSEPEGLSISICEILLSNYCRVNICSEKHEAWKVLSSHLKDNINLEVINTNEFKDSIEYLIFESKLFSKIEEEIKVIVKKEEDNIKKALKVIEERKVRGVFIFPRNYDSQHGQIFGQLINKFFGQNNINVEIVYIDPPIGPRMLLTNRFFCSRLIKQLIRNETLNIPSDIQTVKPLAIADSAKSIVRQLFSFSFPGENIILEGNEIALDSLIKNIQEILGIRINVNYVNERFIQLGSENRKIIIGNREIAEGIKSTIEWFKKNNQNFLIEENLKVSGRPREIQSTVLSYPVPDKKQESVKIVERAVKVDEKKEIVKQHKDEDKQNIITLETKKKKGGEVKAKSDKRIKTRDKDKSIFRWLFLSIFILISPFMLLGFSIFSLYAGEKTFLQDELTTSRVLGIISKNTSIASVKILNIYSIIPKIGGSFSSIGHYAMFVKTNSNVLIDTVDIALKGDALLNNILGTKPYDTLEPANELSLSLNALYRELSFLEAEYKVLKKYKTVDLKELMRQMVLIKDREKLENLRLLVENLPNILGQEKPKTYIVILQNNFNTRPTGGFIETVAVLKFDKGRLTDSNVIDVRTADEQLKGSVEPPQPIKYYLSQENWYLKDSNWDPDFTQSAIKAEWFLEKEMDISADGVIALDLTTVRDLISVFGQITVKEFNQELTEENFYDVFMAKEGNAEESNKGIRFSTALTQALISQVLELNSKGVEFFKVVFNSLASKGIQAYLNDSSPQNAISKLDWNGRFTFPVCTIKNCFSDWAAVVNANMANNNAGYYITQEKQIDIKVDHKKLTRALTINMENSANPVLGYDGKYRDYIRFYIPKDSSLGKIQLGQGSDAVYVTPVVSNLLEYKEVGFFIEVSPGETKKIMITWSGNHNMDITQDGEYYFYVRKQAGVDKMDVNTAIEFPKDVNLDAIYPFSLTGLNTIEYNTKSSRDIFSRISFKK